MEIQIMMDAIKEAIAIAFDKNGLDYDKFCQNIIAFNSTRSKVIAIYDSGDSIDRTFVLVGILAKAVGPELYKVVYFKDSAKNGLAGHYDGIDAMCDADGFLDNYK